MPVTEQAVLKFQVVGADSATKEVTKFVNTTTQGMSKADEAIGRSLGNIAKQYLSIAATFKTVQKVVTTGLGFNKFVEESTVAFSVMSKSAAKAQEQIKSLYDFAVKSPLTFKETVSASRQLTAYGFAAKEIIPTMKTLGTVAKATGGSLDDISYVYGTLRTQGRAYTRDLMQFAMRGIPIYEELANVLGVPVQQIQKLTEEGKVGFREVEQAFRNMTSSGGRFAGMLDQYMTTLSGKISMLTDVLQQTSGTLTKGVFEALKTAVDTLTKTLLSSNMQDFFKQTGREIGLFADILFKMLNAIVRLLPILTQFFKVWLLFKGAGVLLAAWKALPEVLFKLAVSASSAATGVGALSAVGGNAAASVSLLATGISTLNASLSTLGISLAGIAALAGGLTVVGAALKSISDAKVGKTMAAGGEAAKALLASQVTGVSYAGLSTEKQLQTVEQLAKAYNLTGQEVADILVTQKAITSELVKQQLRAKYISDEQKYRQAPTGQMGRYFDSTLKALGISPADIKGDKEPKVFEYLEKFTANLPSLAPADALKAAGVSGQVLQDAYEKVYKERVENIATALNNLIERDVLNPADANPRLQKALAEMLNDAQKQLENFKKKVKNIDPFYDRELMAKATETKLDDIQLAFDKEMANANRLYAEGIITANQLTNAKIALADIYYDEVDKFSKEQAEKERKRLLETYSKMTGGDPKFFEDLKVEAAKAYEDAAFRRRAMGGQGALASDLRGAGLSAASQLQGSEVGSLVAGANPIAMVFQKLMEFALEIENVKKVIMPFNTVIESAGRVIGPILNVAFQGLASVVEEVGGVLGDILAPILSTIASVFQIVAGIIKITVVPVLQLLGKAFAWFNDYVIVPVGNAFIRAINGVIYALNTALGWLGVNIGYLEELKTTTQQLNEAMKAEILIDSMQYAADKLNGLVDEQIKSLTDLYEVGAITASEFAQQAGELNLKKVDLNQKQIDETVKLLNTVDSLYAWIRDNLPAYNKANNSNVVLNSGPVTLPPSRSVTPSGMQVNVYVAGNVTAEKELATTISNEIYTQQQRGYLPA